MELGVELELGNYSSITLTPGMDSYLSKGLNFSPTPARLTSPNWKWI